MRIAGFMWPDDIGERYQHALSHVGSLEWALAACRQKRTAIQAGGNIGLWPKRMAEVFERVYTFEPDPIARACLEQNVLKNVTVLSDAIGDQPGACAIKHRGVGSHRVVEGTSVPITTIDALQLTEVDFLQLDVEGYEWHALKGAEATIARWHPLIQVELRDFTNKYGQTDAAVRQMLAGWGYREVAQRPGSDFVFRHQGTV